MPLSGNRGRLERKLVGTYVALSVLITLMSLGGSRLIQRNADRERLRRAGLMQVTEQLAGIAGSAAEEGFSYVVAGDHGEADQALAKLADLRARVLAMPGTIALTSPEVEALGAVAPAAEHLGLAARAMFAAYEATARVPTEQYEGYDQAVDALGDKIATFHDALSEQVDRDLRRAHRTADALTVIAGLVALLAGLGLGKALGSHITRPISALRDATVAFGAGRETSPLPLRSRDEVGELTDAFNHMVVRTKEHITTIAAAERRLHDIIASMGEMLLVCDDEGLIVEMNPVAIELSGYSESYLRGIRIGSLFSCEDLPGSSLASALPRRAHDTSLRTAEGKNVPIRLTLSRLHGGGGFVCVAQDLTERQRLEIELRQAHKMDAIGRLAGGIAHDFNNMLSIILGYASFLLDGLAESDPSYGPLREMKVAGERSADLTKQLLSFSRQTVLEATRVDLDAAVEATAKMVRRVLPEGVVVSVDATCSDCGVAAEPGQIEQIVMNLLINARDAMPTGGTIAIETTRVETLAGERMTPDSIPPGRYAKLTVADDGMGMDETTVEHIFEPFFTTKEQGKGTGLGLSTVFGIVHRCDGHIFVDSQPGKGTRFRIYLPECPAPEHAAPPCDPDLPQASALAIVEHVRAGSLTMGAWSRPRAGEVAT